MEGLAPALCLHIGAHKTGTSALQSFLARNFRELRELGVHYPPSHTNSLASSGRTTSGNGAALIQQMLDARHVEGTAFRKRFVHQLHHSREPIVLLSSETFWGSGFPLLPQVAELATRAGRETRIVVYLRPQSEIVVSAWSEAVKRRGFTGTPEEYFKKQGDHFKYLPKLERLEDWFGRDQLTVRPYVREAFAGKDLVADFLALFGLDDWRDRFEETPAVNTSLSEQEIALFLALNRLGANARVLANLFDEFPAPAVGAKTPLNETLAEAVAAAYASSNCEISERFFDGYDWLSRLGPIGRRHDTEIAEDSRILAVFLVRIAEKLNRLATAKRWEAERSSRLEVRLEEQAEAIRTLEERIKGKRSGED